VVNAQPFCDLPHRQVRAGAALAELVEEGLKEPVSAFPDRCSHVASVDRLTTVEYVTRVELTSVEDTPWEVIVSEV
jgi:hypothetical protein